MRQLLRTPAFSLVAILMLAIGIGANTALFTFADAVLARSAPGVHTSDRIVWITPRNTHGGFGTMMSYADFTDYRDASGALDDAAAYANINVSVSGPVDPARVRAQIVSASYFSLLGVQMAMGRTFTAEEDTPGHPVAVVSYSFWHERLNADPAAIGKTIVVDSQAVSIVGVAPERFNGADLDERQRALWVPIGMQPVVAPRLALASREHWWFAAFGRLKPDVSVAQATSAVATVASRIAREDSASHSSITASVAPMRGGVRPNDLNDIIPVATLAAAATGLILLICCANVANMLLARGVGRRREMAVRRSLGATRARVIRQLLGESMWLAAAGAVGGLVLAAWATDAMMAVLLPFVDVAPRPGVVAFAVAVAVATALISAVVPALHATRADPASALKDSTIGFDPHRSRLQGAFVVAQVSLSLMLLVTSGMFLDALYRASREPLGFEATSHVLAASVDLDLQGYTPERATTFINALQSRAAALPGVVSVSTTNNVPLGETRNGVDIALDTHESDQTSAFSEGMGVYENVVRPGFFRTIGIDIAAGRDFSSADVPSSEGVIVVSEDFARRAWPGATPLGKHVSVTGPAGPYLTVIGVARTALTFGVGERLRPIVYRSQVQSPSVRDVTLLVRSESDATTLAPMIRGAIHDLDTHLPIYAMRSLGQYRHDRLSDMSIGSTLLGIIGALAVSLAGVGLYAVIAFGVGQRSREIGIRMALGAAQRQVSRLFVRQGLRLASVGLAIGLAASAGVAKLLSSVFHGVTSSDAFTFVAIASLVGGVALVASWIPARRAARIDPMVALRAD
ncbi:MAG: ABC transporter permease [Gemmatimonadaceae bacterium]